MENVYRVLHRIQQITTRFFPLPPPPPDFAKTLQREMARQPAAAAEPPPSTPSSAWAFASPAAGEEPFAPLVRKIAQESGLPEAMLHAVVKNESGFNPRALSPKGAMGLMQLMPQTAQGLGVLDPFDPEQNLRGGARYLTQLFERFGSWERALAAYNAGPSAVERYGGTPPFNETQNFVRKVMDDFRRRGGPPAESANPGWAGQPASAQRPPAPPEIP